MGSERSHNVTFGEPQVCTITLDHDRESITEILEEELRDFVWDRLPKTTTFEQADEIVKQMFSLIEDAWPEGEAC